MRDYRGVESRRLCSPQRKLGTTEEKSQGDSVVLGGPGREGPLEDIGFQGIVHIYTHRKRRPEEALRLRDKW